MIWRAIRCAKCSSASLNTDDPGVSAIDLPHEFDVAAPAAGLSRKQIRQTQINALETSFLSETVKAALRSKVNQNKD